MYLKSQVKALAHKEEITEEEAKVFSIILTFSPVKTTTKSFVFISKRRKHTISKNN